MNGFCVACGGPVAEGALRCADCAARDCSVWVLAEPRPIEREEGESSGLPQAASAKTRQRFVEAAVTLVIISFMTTLFVPRFMRSRARGQAVSCKHTMMNIGVALDMYSTDNNGRYPTALRALVPQYLKQLPVCASSGEDSYSPGYTSFFRGGPGLGESTFTVVCRGWNHSSADYGANFPQYTSSNGLRLR